VAIKLLVVLEEDATEEEMQMIADVIALAPVVNGVWQMEHIRLQCDERVTHEAPALTQ
jgi:hypothetical protein